LELTTLFITATVIEHRIDGETLNDDVLVYCGASF